MCVRDPLPPQQQTNGKVRKQRSIEATKPTNRALLGCIKGGKNNKEVDIINMQVSMESPAINVPVHES
jgi:hypothetical protein